VSEDPHDRRSIARAAGLVGLLTLLSRIAGMVRDSVIAAAFSRGATDAFFIAFRIPNVLRALLAEGSMTVALIPVLTERRRRSEDEARAFTAAAAGSGAVVLLFACAVGIVLAPWIVRAFAYGFVSSPEKLERAVTLTRMMFPYLLFVGLTALAMGVLNTLGHFAAPALSPVALNLAIIAGALGLAPLLDRLGWDRAGALAIGVLLGGGLQLALQLPPLRKLGYLPVPRVDFGHPGVREVGSLMAPAVFGLAIYQINILLAGQFASFLGDGAVSHLYYAQRLVEFPMGLFSVAMATAAMPALSAQAAAGDHERLLRTWRGSLRLSLFVVVPASIALAWLAVPLCAVIYQRGRFDAGDTRATAGALAGFAAGMWAAAGVRGTVPLFYALKDTRTPVRVAALSLVAYVAAAWLLRGPSGIVGLAVAVALASTVNLVGLLWALRRKVGRLGLRALAGSTLRDIAAGVAAVGLAALVARAGRWSEGGSLAANYGVLLAAVLTGVAAFVWISHLMRAEELSEIAEALRRRRRS
jgi:putative peptidoglycan lipid II flippase